MQGKILIGFFFGANSFAQSAEVSQRLDNLLVNLQSEVATLQQQVLNKNIQIQNVLYIKTLLNLTPVGPQTFVGSATYYRSYTCTGNQENSDFKNALASAKESAFKQCRVAADRGREMFTEPGLRGAGYAQQQQGPIRGERGDGDLHQPALTHVLR